MFSSLFRSARAAFVVGQMQLRENLARCTYLVATLAVAVAAWLGLSALTASFVQVDAAFSGILIQSVRQGDALPLRYAEQIESVPGALDVAWMNYLPVLCKQNVAVTLNAWGGSGTHRQLVDYGVTPTEETAFEGDPLGILVGEALAEQCGWRVGMSVQPPDGFWGNPVEVHIVGIFRSSKSWGGQIALAHYEYLNRVLPTEKRDRTQYVSVVAHDSAANSELARRIEIFFAASDPPVEALTDSTVQNGLARFGNVQALLFFVMAAMFACTALVLVSMWAHAAARQRVRMAVLQALGFTRDVLFAGFVLECVVVALLGVAVGAGLGLALIHALAPKVTPILGSFVPPTFAWTLLPAWVLPLLVIGMVIPAVITARVRPTDCRG